MPTIQERISKTGVHTWRVGWRADGRQRWSPTLTTGQGADELLALIERIGPDAAIAALMRRSGRDTSSGPPLLSEWLERHIEMLGASATPGTISDYERIARRTWLPRLGSLPLDAITRETVIDWVAWQRRQETRPSRLARARATRDGTPMPPVGYFSPKTIGNAHRLLSAVLSSAVKADIIPKNAARGIPLPRDDAEMEREIFTSEEWRRFIEAMDPAYVPFTSFMVETGVRIGEVTALFARDFDLDATTIRDGYTIPMPTVRIRRAWKKGATPSASYIGAPKSRRGNRTIVLSQALADILRPLLSGLNPDDLAFTTPLGARIHPDRYRERQWLPAMRKAGITKHLTPHSLRHTSASWLLMAGVPAQVVQHRLGHEDLSTTSRVYAHLLTDAQLVAAQVAARGMAARQIEK